MRKSLATRVLGLVVLYCAVFFILVMLQFSSKGNFTLSTGEMTIRGRYLQASQASLYASQSGESGWRQIAGGVKVFYGGLEISLAEERENGMILTDSNGVLSSANPDYMLVDGGRARFGLPDGTMVVFNSFETARGPELQISAEFVGDISEISIPIVNRRSSMIRENNQLGILYNGVRYFFGSSSRELENSKLVLSRDDALISYRPKSGEDGFDLSYYVTAQSRDYENALANWRNSSFAYWNQNAQRLQNEDDVIAFLSEALRRNQFPAALGSISGNFVNSSAHSFRSSVFVGGMTAAYRSFITAERERSNRITNLIRERSLDIFMEEHVLDFLLTRSNSTLANDFLDFVRNTEPEMLNTYHFPGLLETHSDFRRWRPAEGSIIGQFADHILLLISENIHRDGGNDIVFVSNNESDDIENNLMFNLRLGKALLAWAEDTRSAEWAEVSRSLILSALTGGGVGAGNLYGVLSPEDYYPRETWLSNNGLWVWTVTPSARAAYDTGGNLNISVSFPVNMAHYIIISGVRPFARIQIHGTDWRTDSQFERYDSSGWIYYQQDQILIFKIRHRTTVESIGIFYSPEQPAPPVPSPTPAPAENNAG